MRYLYRRGKGARRRVLHLAQYDPHGHIAQAWCGAAWDTSINVSFGLRVCIRCQRLAYA